MEYLKHFVNISNSDLIILSKLVEALFHLMVQFDPPLTNGNNSTHERNSQKQDQAVSADVSEAFLALPVQIVTQIHIDHVSLLPLLPLPRFGCGELTQVGRQEHKV